MGNWHCVPSSCAEVVYQEYLPPQVRWRYPGENWQEIIGADDYLTTQPKGQCDTGYLLEGRFEAAYQFNTPAACRGLWEWYSDINNPITGQILGWEEVITNSFNSYWVIVVKKSDGSIFKDNRIYDRFYRTRIRNVTNCSQSGARGWKGGSFFIDSIVRADQQPDNCGDCTFTITKNGAIVHTETRAICPEVEKLPCRLSPEIKRIEIEKLAYLERVEVRDQSINTVYLPPANTPLIDVSPLPTECLDIYLTYVLAAPFLSNYVPLPGAFNLYQKIAQICSAPDCPPPQYQVLCNSCGCESCPSGTCAIECGEHICCYNDDGVSVAQIPLENYCGGNS